MDIGRIGSVSTLLACATMLASSDAQAFRSAKIHAGVSQVASNATSGTVTITYTWANTGNSQKVVGTVPPNAVVDSFYIKSAPNNSLQVNLTDIQLWHSYGQYALVYLDNGSPPQIHYPDPDHPERVVFAGGAVTDGRTCQNEVATPIACWSVDAGFNYAPAQFTFSINLIIAWKLAQAVPPKVKNDFDLQVTRIGTDQVQAGGAPAQFFVSSNVTSGASIALKTTLFDCTPAAQTGKCVPYPWGAPTPNPVLTMSGSSTTMSLYPPADAAPGIYWFELLATDVNDATHHVEAYPSVSVAKYPAGNLDGVSSSGLVSGWSYDPSNSSASNEVVVYVSNTVGGPTAWILRADQPRPDVNAAFNITGNHGFVFQLPQSMLSANHSVTAYGQYTVDHGGVQKLLGSTINYCSYAAGFVPGVQACQGQCVRATPPSGNGVCGNPPTDCGCGNESAGAYCYIGPNSCASTHLVGKVLSGAQQVAFNGSTSFVALNNSTSSFSFSTTSARGVTVTLNYLFDHPSGPSTMGLNIRVLVDGIELGRDSKVPRGQQRFVHNIGPIASGSHVLTIEVQSVLLNGPPTTVTVTPGALDVWLNRG